MRKNNIYGILLFPCSTNIEEHKKVCHTSTHGVKNDFMKSYSNHLAGMEIVANCAKIYILENYKKSLKMIINFF